MRVLNHPNLSIKPPVPRTGTMECWRTSALPCSILLRDSLSCHLVFHPTPSYSALPLTLPPCLVQPFCALPSMDLGLGSWILDLRPWILDLDLGSGGDPGPCALDSFVPPGNIEPRALGWFHCFIISFLENYTSQWHEESTVGTFQRPSCCPSFPAIKASCVHCYHLVNLSLR